MGTPQLFAGCERVAIGDFLDEFDHCDAQERLGHSPANFQITRLADFYGAVQDAELPWGLDHALGRYVFHDNLVAARQRGNVEIFDELFDRHQPTDEFIDLSSACPCVGMRLTFGGPNSGTPPHAHGATQCLLLAGEKQWWFWQPQADALVEWITRCAVAANRIEFWRQHIAPIVEGETGDVTAQLFHALDRLAERGLFRPVDPDPDHHTYEYSMRALGRVDQLRAAGAGVLAEHLVPFELTQQAGEIVVFPELWSHAVRNTSWHLAVIYELQLQDTPVTSDRRPDGL